MSAPTRRAFLGFAQNAVAAAAVGAIGFGLIEAVEAMPLAPNSVPTGTAPNLVTPAQWGPSWGPGPGWGPGWGPPP